MIVCFWGFLGGVLDEGWMIEIFQPKIIYQTLVDASRRTVYTFITKLLKREAKLIFVIRKKKQIHT